MKYCNKCGTEREHLSKFCNKCGNKFSSNTKQSFKETEHESKENLDADINNNYEYNYNEESINKVDNTINYDKEILNNFDKPDTKKEKNKYIISTVIIIIILLSSASVIYFYRNSILYNYYYSKANSSISNFEKLTNYNNALKHKYDTNIIDSIYDTLKGEPSFIDELTKVNNLTKEDTNNLIYKLCVFYLDKNFKNEDYDSCIDYLDLATEYGYNEKDYSNYDELMEKLNE